jgi:hypothetical protein
MCKLFKTKYRIVKDNYDGFEAQFKRWWMPFYMQCFGVNTSPTLEKAKYIIYRHKNEPFIIYEEC